MAKLGKTGPIGYNLTEQFAVIMKNLNAEIKKIPGRSLKGLIESSIIIRRDTEDTSPITPVDKGNLRASWFTVSIQGKVEDPVGSSGHFKDNKKAGIKASQMKSEHSTLIAECQSMTAGEEPVVIMGYSANYAAPVHEMMGANFQRLGAGPKWFETAVYRNKDKILKTVAKNAYIK